MKTKPFVIHRRDGVTYLVFSNEMEAEDYLAQYGIPYMYFVCFSGYMNGVRVD